MIKRELIKEISSQTGSSRNNVYQVIEAFTQIVMKTVKGKEKVILRRFGTFRVVLKKEKNFPIPGNKIINIPAHFEPSFKPSEELTKMIADIPIANKE